MMESLEKNESVEQSVKDSVPPSLSEEYEESSQIESSQDGFLEENSEGVPVGSTGDNEALPASDTEESNPEESGRNPVNTEEDQPRQRKPKGKKVALLAALAVLAIAIIVVFSNNSGLKKDLSDADSLNTELQQELNDANAKIKELESKVTELEGQIDELENGASAQLVEIKNAYDAQDWDKVVSLAASLHKEYNGVPEDNEAQQLAADAQKKIDEAAAAKAAEEAKGFETGITYDQLARTPDDFVGSKVKFYGKVVQVIEGDDKVQLRLAVNGDYDQILFLEYESSLVNSRVLEDDYITIYGISAGTITYESTMGGKITIPAVAVSKIDQ